MTTTTRTALLALWERCPECKPPAIIVDKAFRNLQGHRLFEEHAELLAEAAITRWLTLKTKKTVLIEFLCEEWYCNGNNADTLLDALITAANAALDSK